MEKLGIEFKLIIAYLVSGIIGLYAVSLHVPTVHKLLGGDTHSPIGTGIVLVVILSIGVGIIINAVTWATIRPLIELLGTKRPDLPYHRLNKNLMYAYSELLEGNFRFYQSYSNILTSLLLLLTSIILSEEELNMNFLLTGAIFCGILFFAARDSLGRTYRGMDDLFSENQEVAKMTNNNPAPTSADSKEGKKSNGDNTKRANSRRETMETKDQVGENHKE